MDQSFKSPDDAPAPLVESVADTFTVSHTENRWTILREGKEIGSYRTRARATARAKQRAMSASKVSGREHTVVVQSAKAREQVVKCLYRAPIRRALSVD